MVAAALCSATWLPVAAQAQDAGFSMELASLDLEELMNIQITSVSRHDESLSSAAASIFVITSNDIRRSGATSIPEILRLAPNLQVARINAYEYAITARGFNNRVGNKLLVMLDGRTLYTPLFSGVFWEMQDTNLEDIERIEIISGPGGTLWGANAVNGIINIITRSAEQTGSTLVSAAGGNAERGVTLRTGGRINERLDWRVYGKASEWDHTTRATGAAGLDDWSRQQVGFRADYEGGSHQLVLQGDTLRGESAHRGLSRSVELPPVEVESTNLHARWTRQMEAGSELNVQAYYSYNKRSDVILFSPTSSIFDIEARHHVIMDLAGVSHEVVWGGGLRHAHDKVKPGFFSTFIPARRELNWENLFIQDEISLGDNLRLTPGIKLEWNDYTGVEYLPGVNLAWQATDSHLLWTGWSRAVRAPSRFDRDVYFPDEAPFVIAGGPDFQAEVARVLEAGMRGQPADTLSYAVTLYHYDWQRLRSGTALPLPLYLVNNIEGESWGVEAWGTWQLAPGWQVRAGFNTLEKDLTFGSDAEDTVGVDNATLHNDPDYQWMLRSSIDLAPAIQVDVQLRRVAELDIEQVPGYAEVDLRLGWQPLENVEVSFTGTNLLHGMHAEYGPVSNRLEISRSILVGFKWVL